MQVWRCVVYWQVIVEAQKLCHKLDKDGSSGVSFDEFAAYYEKKLKQAKRFEAAVKKKKQKEAAAAAAAAAAGNWACNTDYHQNERALNNDIDRVKADQN